ncbi:MAG: endolytic transglycosylase MltG [Phenylobacterium sp.]|uniref:endolytic transglycosylase MltG n=1 Tax=Phenylobacterium sp. TaxID=1871053 RepID=UPI00391CEE44
MSRRPRSRTSRKGGLAPLRRLAIIVGSAGATLALVLAVALGWALWTFQGPGPRAAEGEQTTVVLRRGASLPEIASTLERAGVVRSSAVFMTAAQLTGGARDLKAGEYAIASRASMAQILKAVRAGDVVRHFITIPEGMTSQAVADVLARSEVLTGVAPVPPEGAVLPETYQVERGEDRAAVLKRMMDERDALVARLWAERQPGLPFATPEEAVILASVVEKETGVAAERPRVAAVFINRLRKGMRLESDPTIIYGLTGGKPLGRGIRLSELTSKTPYNTYMIDGLPPTPIANPGREALAAVMDPPKTEDLFFVADGSGGHAFSPTYDEHLKNVERWRTLEKQQAAKGGEAKAPAK